MKIFLILIFFITFSFSKYEKVSIGKIDDYYHDKITFSQLENIIKEIEQYFESELGFNVFDYEYNGKPIDLIYMPPSKLQKQIDRRIIKLDSNIKKLDSMKDYFLSKKIEIDRAQKDYDSEVIKINSEVQKLNDYVTEANRHKYTKQKFEEIKAYIEKRKNEIKENSKYKDKLERNLKKLVLSYNNKIISFNNLANESKRLSKEIENLSKNNLVVKGRAFGETNITTKTYIKDGKKYQEKDISNSMKKIEIYNFESLSHLKAVLAHEIAHLVGIPHINSSKALMNPILQKNQINELELTHEDLINFRQNFN